MHLVTISCAPRVFLFGWLYAKVRYFNPWIIFSFVFHMRSSISPSHKGTPIPGQVYHGRVHFRVLVYISRVLIVSLELYTRGMHFGKSASPHGSLKYPPLVNHSRLTDYVTPYCGKFLRGPIFMAFTIDLWTATCVYLCMYRHNYYVYSWTMKC